MDCSPEPPTDDAAAVGRAFPHLARETVGVLDQDVPDRVAYALSDHWIGYTAATEAIAAMGDLMRRPTAATTSPSLLLLGRAGNGKTTILDRFAALHPSEIRTTGDLTARIVRVTIPPGASESEFWSELLLSCNGAHRLTDPVLVKRNQALGMLDTLRPKMLIADEMNNLLLGSGSAQRMLMARIRELTNRLRMHLVFAGTEDAQRAADSDVQLDRRFVRYELPKWTYGTDLRRLLKSFERVLPLPEPSGLSDQATASEIMSRSDGTIASIARIVKEAAANAINEGRSRIDADAIRAVRVDTSEERQRRARSL